MNWFSKKRIYMDYAAATPVLPEVKRAMEKYWSKEFYNPNAIYAEGLKVKKELSEYRKKIAEIMGAREEGVIFTSGATEANWLSATGLGANLVSSTAVDNKLGRKIKEERKKNNSDYPLLHIDATQSVGFYNITLESLACDLITISSSKIYGPKGMGALIVRRGLDLKIPERGTPAVPLIAGFAKALEILMQDREAERERLSLLSAKFVEVIDSAQVTYIEPNIINISVPGILPELLALALEREGILVSVGRACSSNKPEPAETPVRFSFGRFTTEIEVNKAAKILCKTVKNLLKLHRAAV